MAIFKPGKEKIKTNIHNILIGFCVAAASIGTLAQTSDEHKNHHPTGTTQSASATKESTGKPMNADKIASIDKQIKNMQAMHEKMVSAKTPEERQELMAEHMKMMQDGMGMMKQMSGMPGMSGIESGKGMNGSMADRQQMIEKRMEMMESMMQMMMDRMPPAPAK